MQQTIIKPKQISTELNYFYNTNKRIQALRKQGNKSRLLIIFLILWNIFLTWQALPIQTPIPQFTDAENELIMQLEEIPI